MKRFVRRAVTALLLTAAGVGAVGVAPAQAGTWTVLERGFAGSVLLACKSPESGGYGPVWRITLVLANDHGQTNGSARVDVVRGWNLVSRTHLSTPGDGQWDVKVTYASRLFDDHVVGSAGWGMAGGTFNVDADDIGNC